MVIDSPSASADPTFELVNLIGADRQRHDNHTGTHTGTHTGYVANG